MFLGFCYRYFYCRQFCFAGESTTDPAESTEETGGDPATCPILVGKRTYIEIEKGKTGLGLSIVGGSDTLLVSCLAS